MNLKIISNINSIFNKDTEEIISQTKKGGLKIILLLNIYGEANFHDLKCKNLLKQSQLINF